MTGEELVLINQKIAGGELYYHSGLQVQIELKQALVTDNHTYFYPIVDDVLFLRKETAVAGKNRVKNPLLRLTETDVELFFKEFSSLKPNASQERVHVPNCTDISNDKLKELQTLLPKAGDVFMSAVSQDTDALHNLVFNTQFNHYLHVDFSLDRLNAVKQEVKKGTIMVLCEMGDLPFETDSIDALFSFDHINSYDKPEQNKVYEELKRVLKGDGSSIVLYAKDKPLHAQAQLKTDQLTKKALGIFAPWKKKKVPTIYFHPVQPSSNGGNSEELYGKTSFGRQLS